MKSSTILKSYQLNISINKTLRKQCIYVALPNMTFHLLKVLMRDYKLMCSSKNKSHLQKWIMTA